MLDPCSAVGSPCDTNDECCNASGPNPTAACRVVVNPPPPPVVKQCTAVSSVCAQLGAACTLPTDCCGFPNVTCTGGFCVPPPPLLTFQNGTYTRVYSASCPPGKRALWTFFDWQAVTASDSRISFFVQAADQDASAVWDALALTPLGSVPDSTGHNYYPPNWMGVDVSTVLAAADARKPYLKVSMQLIPSADRRVAPVLVNWRQAYTCEDAQ